MSGHAIVHLISPTHVYKTQIVGRGLPKLFSVLISEDDESLMMRLSDKTDANLKLPMEIHQALVRATGCEISRVYVPEPTSPAAVSRLTVRDSEWRVLLE